MQIPIFTLQQMCSFKVVEMVMTNLSYETDFGFSMYSGQTEHGDDEILRPYLKDKISEQLILDVLDTTSEFSDICPQYRPGKYFLMYLQSERNKEDIKSIFGYDEYFGFTRLEQYLFDENTRDIKLEKFILSIDKHITYFGSSYFRCPRLRKYWIDKFSKETLEKFDEACRVPGYESLLEHRHKLVKHWCMEE